MRCLAHISDLHFGTENPEIADALVKELRELCPTLLALSGDLTQRARAKQFRAAREFLDRIPFEKISVPGNHDIPLFDIIRRFLAPHSRYRKFIADEVNPAFEDSQILLLGVNTARSLTWKSGRVSFEQIENLQRRLAESDAAKFKIIMTHHPFIPPPGDEVSGVDLVGRAANALVVFDQAGVDLLLAGHLHHGYSGDVRTYYPATRRSIIVAQAGTAISRRIRSQPNSYNVLRLEKDTIDIEVRTWERTCFEMTNRLCYALSGSEWQLQRKETSK